MVKLALHSIAYEAKTLNLAKEGSTTFYVDGTDGSDIHDGGSWAQAFKTIQHAINESESWTKIFIKAGTYAENAVIDKQGIRLIGEKRSTTIVNVSSGVPIEIKAEACTIESMKVYSGADYVKAIDCAVSPSSKFTELINVEFDGKSGTSHGPAFGSSYCTMHDCYFSNANMVRGLSITNVGYCKAYNNFIKLTHANSMGIYTLAANNNILFENELDSCRDGINVGSTCSDNSIFHNNFIGNTNQTVDQSPGNDNEWFENFYDDHVTDSNSSGLADTPYTFTGGVDYQPLSRRNGWKQGSLPTIDDSLFKKVSKSITLSTAAPIVTQGLFVVTGEVECYVVGYIDAAVTSAGALTLRVGVSTATSALIAETAVGDLSKDMLWIDASPATVVSQPSKKIITNGLDISHAIVGAAATAGAITYYCWWRPLSSDGNVVAT